MKRKTIFFLTVLLIVLMLLIYGAVNGQPSLVQLGLGALALYLVIDWLIPALRRPPVERPSAEDAREVWQRS